jgi:deazaflavin-dependent oxidoreductase (nitroreductase family)
MPAPRWMAKVNRRVTNRVTGTFAPRLPGFGVVLHEGRRSGRRYRTPVNVFRAPGGYVVALTYGVESDWVRNVVAGGGCELLWRGRRVRCSSPRIVHDETRRGVPPPVRIPLRLLGVADFLLLDDEPARPDPAGATAAADDVS